ncbi:hypothetical protein HPB51_022740 [Rhipicephalus microplus]|uniref:Uncharacterized protein n=1 Tax=Rhipicephalus microplus TaxID=6941 RepID=A0A9J6EIX6_RHIMP|nr:hypothetical protein HPB51_022740 [Rhipicephalus microplus]
MRPPASSWLWPTGLALRHFLPPTTFHLRRQCSSDLLDLLYAIHRRRKEPSQASRLSVNPADPRTPFSQLVCYREDYAHIVLIPAHNHEDLSQHVAYQHDETTINSHIDYMVKDIKHPIPDLQKLGDYMEQTRPSRQKWMKEMKPSTADVLLKYPALAKAEMDTYPALSLKGKSASEAADIIESFEGLSAEVLDVIAGMTALMEIYWIFDVKYNGANKKTFTLLKHFYGLPTRANKMPLVIRPISSLEKAT